MSRFGKDTKPMKVYIFVILMLLMILGTGGCLHPIAGPLRDQVDPKLTFTEIFHSPESFVGKKIILWSLMPVFLSSFDRGELFFSCPSGSAA